MTAVLGVDPGGRYLGLVGRRGDQLLGARVVDRNKVLPALVVADAVACRKQWTAYAVVAVADALDALAAELDLGDATEAVRAGRLVLGVEDVVAPNRHSGRERGAEDGIASMGPVIDTAVVLGRILAGWPDLVLVRPRSHGKGPDFAYPVSIRPGRRNLGGPPIHARAAWDVAGTAAACARLEAGRARHLSVVPTDPAGAAT